MLQSSFFDPVLGVDIHIVMVPTPAPVPTPVPMPFVGMVFDPVGLAVGAAIGMATGGGPGLVMVNSLPVTNAGTNVTNMMTMPHLPVPGVAFAKGLPGNDAELFFGSLNVTLGGSLGVRLGEIAMSCSDPVRLPTSVVLAIPKGMPVLTIRPPVPDVQGIAMRLAMLGAMKLLKAAARGGARLFRALRAAQRNSRRWARVSGFMRGVVDRIAPERFRDRLKRAVCFVTGHPVDVATGRVFTDNVDFELPGPLPLVFERVYSSSLSWRNGPLGYGWSHSLDQQVWLEYNKVVFLAEDGREIEFSTLDLPDRVIRAGQSLYNPSERLTLRCIGPFTWEIETAEGITHEFAPVRGGHAQRARILRKYNQAGEEITWHYDEHGHLQAVRDCAGRLIGFEYEEGRLVSVSTSSGASQPWLAQRVFAYDVQGNLVEAKDAAGQSWRFEYVEHLLVRETNRNGLSFYFQYDGLGATARCVRTWGDGGFYDHVLSYDLGNLRTLVENSLGHVVVYEMDDLGQVISVTDALGHVTKYEYDPHTGQKCKEIDPLGAETIWEYDEAGNCTKTIGPDGATVHVRFDPKGRPVLAMDPLEGEWSWTYDQKGRITQRVDPLGQRMQFEWEGSRLVGFHDAAGQYTRLEYDKQGNLSRLRAPNGAETQWRYDGFGRCQEGVDAKGNVCKREYDPLGRVVLIHEPDGNVRTVNYDPEGNVVRVRDNYHEVQFTYQGLGQLRSRTESGTTVSFEYDTEGQIVAIKNERGFVYEFEFNPAGAVRAERGFDGLVRKYERDPAGRVTKVVRPLGRVTEYTYDLVGRVTSVKHEDETEIYKYRADGEFIEAINSTTTVKFERDALGRVTKDQQEDDWVASVYDTLGRRVRVSSSRGIVQRIRRNARGDVLEVSARLRDLGATEIENEPLRAGPRGNQLEIGPGFSVSFRRDELGFELERALPGGVRSTWERDRLGRPIRQAIWSPRGSQSTRKYTWDVDDRLNMIVDSLSGPVKYTHDSFGNLVAAAYADGRTELRMPDAVGNLFRTRDQSDRRYGPTGQLLESRSSRGVTRYEYDPEGNLVRKIEPDKGEWRYEWNGAGRLIRVVRPDGGSVEFGYDAFGRRVWKRFRGKTTRWLWDGNLPLHEWVESQSAADPDKHAAAQRGVAEMAATKRRQAELNERPAQGPPEVQAPEVVGESITWLFEPESFAPLAKFVDGEHFSIITDHLGTPTAMLDSQGDKVWGAEIGVYGELSNVVGKREACPFRWPGQYEDEETGLYYNRHRYYGPEEGEYLSQDPLGLRGGLRLLGYVHDPCAWIDPFGLSGGCATKGKPLGDDVVVHRIGGAGVDNLHLKPPEKKLTPPGISLLQAPSAEDAAALAKRVAGEKGWSKMATAAETMGSAKVSDIRAAGFDVIHDCTDTWGEAHARLIHPQGASGFTPENLGKLSQVFKNTTGL